VPRGRLVAVTNATIHTAAGSTVERGTVLIRDGKIAAVGAEVTVPRGAEVIDGTGRHVIPGIIDSHSHMAIEGGINEGSDNLTPQVRIEDEVRHDDMQIWNALAGGVTTAHLLHGSANSIGGQDAVIKLRWGLKPEQLLVENAPQGIKFALGENPKQSNRNAPPGADRRFPNTRMGVEYSIADAFQRARAYQAEWRTYDSLKARARRGQEPLAPRRDLFLETLAGILDGKIRVHAHSYRADEIVMLLDLADSLGFKVATLQHVLEGYKVADEIARHGAGASTFADMWGYKLEAFDAIPHNAALMTERGVRVSVNSDDGERIRRLLQEAGKAVKWGGASEEEALRMVTYNAAADLGLESRIGSIEVGKDADIVILTAPPFDPRARVEKTLIDGIIYFDYDKAPRLEHRLEKKPAHPVTSDAGMEVGR
jgi:imidazolonepropionase-like amidohydrolase